MPLIMSLIDELEEEYIPHELVMDDYDEFSIVLHDISYYDKVEEILDRYNVEYDQEILKDDDGHMYMYFAIPMVL